MKFRNGSQISARRSFCTLFSACALAILLLPGRAQDPLKRYPQNYQLILENAQVSVIHVHYGPNEHVPVHDHSDYATLFVYLSDSGPVRFRIEGVPATSMVRPAVSLGSFRYSPGSVERHSVQSLSQQSSDFLRVELRQFPLQGGEAFRHGAPASLNADIDEKEFSNDQIEVERVVCLAGRKCLSAAVSQPSLIVAFDDVRLGDTSEAKGETLSSGDVRWIEPNNSLNVSASTSAPAHLLRVLIKSPKPRTPIS